MFTTPNTARLAALALSLGFVAATTQLAAAGWAQNHPRRAEVNARLTLQNARITQAENHGLLSPGQANALRAQDHFIRKEERFDASFNGGHITRAEQKSLNQQENGVSSKIP